MDLITPPTRERELYEAQYTTNNLELSDSSDEDMAPSDLPLQQFDKYPKRDEVLAFHHPQPSYDL